MAELRLTDASHKALEERLKSPEGRDAMSRLTRIIVESVVEHFPPDLLRSLDTPEARPHFERHGPRSWMHFCSVSHVRAIQRVSQGKLPDRLAWRNSEWSACEVSAQF